MKTVLVATDFSSASLNAANYAADMALAINANVHLLHVYQTPVIYLEVPVAVNTEDIKREAEKSMNRLREELIRRMGSKLKIDSEVLMGSFFPELESVCNRITPYTVVMGSQGTTAAERVFFGEHATYAMKHLQWPLITVPVGAVFLSIKKIALACDFHIAVDSIPIEQIKLLVNDFDATLNVINAGKQGEFDPEIVFESGLLEEKLAPVEPHFNFISETDADKGILEFAENNNVDLLIVLPKPHGLFDRLVHKSHINQLVRHSPVPVMALQVLSAR